MFNLITPTAPAARRSRRLFPVTLAAVTLLLAACSDDSSTSATTASAPTTATTAAPTTAVPDTTLPDTTLPDTTLAEVTLTAPDTTVAGPVTYIDPVELLNPLTGWTFMPLPDGIADALVQQVSADATMSQQVLAVGATLVQDDVSGAQSLIIFFELAEAYTGADLDEYYTAATAGGTDIIDVDVDGRSGKAFLADGHSSFTTLSGTTAILAQADTTDALQAAVTALYDANPQL
jgi:hypothetical protein